MNRLSHITVFAFGIVVLFSGALPVFAQTNTTQISSCTQAASGASFGTTQASGTYVPTADQAVISNTSQIINIQDTLLRKECILRPLVDGLRKAETSIIVSNGTNAFRHDRNGGPLIVQNPVKEDLYLARDPQILTDMSNGTFDSISTAFKSAIKNMIGRSYLAATRKPTDVLSCSYKGDMHSLLNGDPQGSMQDALNATLDPACNPYLDAEQAYEMAQASNNAAVDYMHQSINQGIYPIIQPDKDGNYVFTNQTEITNPAKYVGDIEEQLLTSGFRMQENANNVNEMVTDLFATVGTQVISNSAGLASLDQPPGGGTGGASFMSQVVSGSGAQLTQITGNLGIQTINDTLAVEQAYLQAANAIMSSITQTNTQLQAVEAQCWVSLAQNVCAPNTLSTDGKTCKSKTSTNLNIATSTAFSQAVINDQLSSLSSSTQASITKANNAITVLNQFVSKVVADNSSANQSTVLSQYNQLVTQGYFHKKSDVVAIQQQQQSVANTTDTLVQNTINTWAGVDSSGASNIPWDNTTDPGEGWCNYQNQPTTAMWAQRWF